MADRNTPASFTFEDFRVEFNELATDVGDINDLPADVRSVAVSDLVEAVNEIVLHLNSAPTFSNESLIFEGTSPDDYETTLSVTNPTADRSIILPDASGDVVLDTATQTLTNKTLTSPVINNPTISGLSFTNIVLEGNNLDDYETTLMPVEPTQDNTIYIPNTDTTLVGTDTTDTLTNKVFCGSSESLTGDGSTPLTVSTSTTMTTFTTGSSDDTGTLANSSNVGQIKVMVLDVDGGGSVAISPTTFANGNTITMQDASDTISLIWTGTNGWAVLSNSGCTIS